MEIAAVIFDCDGVLADTEPLHLAAFNRVLAPLGIAIAPDTYAARYLGLDDRAAFRQVLADHRRPGKAREVEDLIAAKARAFPDMLRADCRVYDGVRELVGSFGAVPCAVASGARREEVDIVLRAAGLADTIAVVVTIEDVAVGKPDPEPFVTALTRLCGGGRSIHPAGCLVVEDSVVGIEAAHRAGMRCLAVTNSHAADALAAADLVVPTLAGLSLAELGRRLS
jgi:HAD superfamily hydrolase (TIGR01509 family)